MKKLVFLFLVFVGLTNLAEAQVKIGQNPEILHENSVLELESTTRALVITRMNTPQMNAMLPLKGALVYNTDEDCVYYYDGSEWVNMCLAESAINISLEDHGNGSYTFTDANGNTTDFIIPSFTVDNTSNPALPSGLVMTRTGNNINFEVGRIIGTEHIQNGTVTAATIATDAVGNQELQDNSVGSAEIANETILPEDIEPSTIGNQVLKTDASGIAVEWGTLDATNIASEDLTATDASLTIGSGGTNAVLTATDIAVNVDGTTIETAANGVQIVDGGVTNAKIANANITDAKLDKANIPISGFGAAAVDVDLGNNNLINVLDPINPQDAATMNYVDAEILASNQTIVSADAGNNITASGTDGGAFYDDSALQTNIATNATDIGTNQTAIAANVTAIGTKEDSANKSDAALGTSTTLFPTQNAVKTYVDAEILASNQTIVSADAGNNITASGTDGGAFYDDSALQTNIATNATDIGTNQTAIAANVTAIGTKEDSANKSTDVTLSDGTNTNFPTELAVKTYVDNQVSTLGNLSTINLTQAAENRTYDLGAFNLRFIGTGNVGIGNGANPPTNKLHVAGAVRSQGILNSDGSVTEPSFRFNGDTDTGLYRSAADEIGFSVGGDLALRIDQPTAGSPNVIVTGAFSTNIRSDNNLSVSISDTDYTVVLTNATDVDLPLPANAGTGFNTGKIYIIKNITGAVITMSSDTFIPSTSATATADLQIGITKLQSDGTNWQQIN